MQWSERSANGNERERFCSEPTSLSGNDQSQIEAEVRRICLSSDYLDVVQAGFLCQKPHLSHVMKQTIRQLTASESSSSQSRRPQAAMTGDSLKLRCDTLHVEA
jgi:hypothetical protein